MIFEYGMEKSKVIVKQVHKTKYYTSKHSVLFVCIHCKKEIKEFWDKYLET